MSGDAFNILESLIDTETWFNKPSSIKRPGPEQAMPSAAEQPNRARAKLMAKDYAKMDAIANLKMAIEGTTISYESTGKDYMADTTISQKIEGFVNNVQITKYWDEKVEGDTIVVVEVRAPMFSATGPGPVFIQEQAKQADAKARIGDRVCLIGNIQYDDLARGTPADVERLVRQAIREGGAGGGFILCPCAAPYERPIPAKAAANLIHYLETAYRYGQY